MGNNLPTSTTNTWTSRVVLDGRFGCGGKDTSLNYLILAMSIGGGRFQKKNVLFLPLVWGKSSNLTSILFKWVGSTTNPRVDALVPGPGAWIGPQALPRKRTAGGPQNDGVWKRYRDPLKIAIFGYQFVRFRGVYINHPWNLQRVYPWKWMLRIRLFPFLGDDDLCSGGFNC